MKILMPASSSDLGITGWVFGQRLKC